MIHAAVDRSEAAEYYFRYIDRVTGHDICSILQAQLPDTLAFCQEITEEQSLRRYEPGKWSIREVLDHINDTERLFLFRAFWFARGFDSPLPSFDQHVAMSHAPGDALPWGAHVEEFRLVRGATIAFFRHLPAEAWSRRGLASDNPFTVRALAFLAAGHVIHHLDIIRQRYL